MARTIMGASTNLVLRGLWSTFFAVLLALHAMPEPPQALPGERPLTASATATALPVAQLRQSQPPAQLSGHRLAQLKQGNPHGSDPALPSAAAHFAIPVPQGVSSRTASGTADAPQRPADNYRARAPPLSA